MMADWQTALRDGAQEFGLTLTAAQEEKFARLLELLLERNKVMNLTAITDPVEVAIKHFLDSLTVETVWVPYPGERAIDIGTGAGFPGLPLAIRYPETKFVLNDSVGKKVRFIEEVINDLALTNASTMLGRAERLGREQGTRELFDVVLARAVAHLGALLEYALPLLRVDGWLIAMKGPSGRQEVAESRRAFAALSGTVEQLTELTLPGGGERQLIVIRKTHPTAAAYPREPGMAKKRPLFP